MEEETFSCIWSDYDFQSYTNKEAALKELSFYQLMFGKAIPELGAMDYRRVTIIRIKGTGFMGYLNAVHTIPLMEFIPI